MRLVGCAATFIYFVFYLIPLTSVTVPLAVDLAKRERLALDCIEFVQENAPVPKICYRF